MIGKILMGIMSLIIGLVNVLLAPIDALIAAALPTLNDALTAVNSMLDYAGTYLVYLKDLTLLSPTAISLIVFVSSLNYFIIIGFISIIQPNVNFIHYLTPLIFKSSNSALSRKTNFS